MYPFNIVRQDSGSWNFELDGINVVTKGYYVKNNKYHIIDPSDAIAFFNYNGHGNIYGLANIDNTCPTVDDFYEKITSHYIFFDPKPITENFFKKYGFKRKSNEWDLDIKATSGKQQRIRYISNEGWYVDDAPMQKQPSNVRDLMSVFVKLTGDTLPQHAS